MTLKTSCEDSKSCASILWIFLFCYSLS